MNRADVLAALYAPALILQSRAPRIDIYLFGSFARGHPSPADIDILFICPDDDSADLSRRVFTDIDLDWPVHLTIMTDAENDETRFLERSEAMPLSEFFEA